MDETTDQRDETFAPRVEAFIQRLYRDPRYLLIGKIERFGREFISFIEGCTLLSATGEVRGQALLNDEYHLSGRPGSFPMVSNLSSTTISHPSETSPVPWASNNSLRCAKSPGSTM